MGYDDILMLSLGTGIGGAAVSGGKLVRGSRSSACEFGHVSVEIDGLPCTCGSKGCLEAYAGGWAITKQAGGIPAEKVFTKAHNGDVSCAAIIDKAIKALGAATASLINAFNPRCVIFAGGITEGHPELVEYVKNEAVSRALKIESERLDWKIGTLRYPGVIGSALSALA
jgi:glucokinase